MIQRYCGKCGIELNFDDFILQNKDIPKREIERKWNLERIQLKNGSHIDFPIYCCECFREMVFIDAFTGETGNYYCFDCRTYSLKSICPVCRKDISSDYIIWKLCKECKTISFFNKVDRDGKEITYCCNCKKEEK